MGELVTEMNNFLFSYKMMQNGFKRNRYIYFEDGSDVTAENNEYIDEIIDIIEFSKPQIETRLLLGKNILKRNIQILHF